MELVICGAIVRDIKKVEAVLETMPFLPPLPQEQHPQHFCAEKYKIAKDVR